MKTLFVDSVSTRYFVVVVLVSVSRVDMVRLLPSTSLTSFSILIGGLTSGNTPYRYVPQIIIVLIRLPVYLLVGPRSQRRKVSISKIYG